MTYEWGMQETRNCKEEPATIRWMVERGMTP